MPAAVETQGQIQEFLDVLRKRFWQILIPAAFVVALGTAFAVIVPKKYVVRTQVELRPTLLDSSGQAGTAVRDVANATYQIRSLVRIKRVVETLEWEDYLSLSHSVQNRELREIKQKIKVKNENRSGGAGSTFVTIEYANTNARRARDFLLQLRDDWHTKVVERDRETLRAKLIKENKDRARLQTLVHEENQKLMELREQNGISPFQTMAERAKDDPVFEQLEADRRQLKQVNQDLYRLELKRENLVGRIAKELDVIVDRTVQAGSSDAEAVQEIETQILALDQKREGLRPLHPDYVRVDLEIQKLEAQRRQLESLRDRGTLREARIFNQEKIRLQRELDDIEPELLALENEKMNLERDITQGTARTKELQQVYTEIREQQKSVDRLDLALEQAELDYFRTKKSVDVISTTEWNPFVITEDPVIPQNPSEPNPILIVLFSVVAGLGLGLGIAVVAEFSKSCFRSVTDISRVMPVPVLGAINTIRTRAERRQTMMRRVSIGFSSIVLIGAVVFVTWAWANSPDLLTQELRDAIETVREKFL